MTKNNIEDKIIWQTSLLAEKESRYPSDVAFLKFQQRVNAQRTKTKTFSDDSSSPRLGVQPFGFSWLGYAASVILLIGLTMWTSWHFATVSMQNTFADIVIESPAGSTTSMILPDGTKVQLAPSSRITYSQGFGIKDRNIQLEGEAKFKVNHDEELPMRVTSSSLSTLDLGTTFTFCDYSEDTEAYVALEEGAVSVAKAEKQTKTMLLEPGQKLSLNKLSGEMIVINEEKANARDITSPILLFNGEPLHLMMRKLERMCDVKVAIENDTIKDLRFHGRFDTKHQTADDILESLSSTGKLRYNRQGDTLTIY